MLETMHDVLVITVRVTAGLVFLWVVYMLLRKGG
jgi:hypothetical protein